MTWMDVPGKLLLEPPITRQHFDKALKKSYPSSTLFQPDSRMWQLSLISPPPTCSKPTVNNAELQNQIKFTEEFGQEG